MTALPEGSAMFLKLSSQAMAAAVEHLETSTYNLLVVEVA